MNSGFHSRRRNEQGYVLLILLLAIALITIGFLAVGQRLEFQIKRDREEELIHRGVQYSRAVRRYFKKLGRYPSRIEDLESTNNMRFLRKRYKDPMNRDPKTGKELDFKPLHMTDVQVSFNPGAASGLPPGADANVSAQDPGAPGALNGTAPGPGGSGPSSIATNSAGQADGSEPDQSTSSTGPSASPQSAGFGAGGAVGSNGNSQTFGGQAIIGVASAVKQKTIREFNKKDRYNQWQFIYDPSTDRGGLLMTPNQPPLQGAGQVGPSQNGEPGQPGQNPPFRQNPSSSFGQNQTNSAPMEPSPQPPDQ